MNSFLGHIIVPLCIIGLFFFLVQIITLLTQTQTQTSVPEIRILVEQNMDNRLRHRHTGEDFDEEDTLIKDDSTVRDKSEYGIHVIGERHSGTSWLHRHLEQCFGDQIKVYDRLSRHKYWFQFDDDSKDYGLVVASFRNVYDWVEAMRRTPLHAPLHYHLEANKPMTLNTFIKTTWCPTRSQWMNLQILQDDENSERNFAQGRPLHLEKCYDGFSFYDIVPCSYNDRVRSMSLVVMGKTSDGDDGADSGAVYEMKKNHGQSGFDVYRNILFLRKDKMHHFYNEIRGFSSVQYYIPVKFEDLVEAGTSSLLEDIQSKMNLKRKCSPGTMAYPVHSDTKIYSKQHISLLNENVDWSVEAYVGYKPYALNGTGKNIIIVDGVEALLNTSAYLPLNEGKEKPIPSLDEPILDPRRTQMKNDTLDSILDSIQMKWHPQKREQRFPSVDDRVKVYMSNWYRPCHNSSELGVRIDYYNRSYPLMTINPDAGTPFRFDSLVQFDMPILLHRASLDICITNNASSSLYMQRVKGHNEGYRLYCQDSLDILNLFDDIGGSDKIHPDQNWSRVPVILQIGDGPTRSRTVPIISKYRWSARNKKSVTEVLLSCNAPYLNVTHRPTIIALWDTYFWDAAPYYQPIIWKLESKRHFGNINETRNHDIPWESKMIGAIWLGDMTGGPLRSRITPDMSSLQSCQWYPRCRFVFLHQNSSLVYARLTNSFGIVKKVDAPNLLSGRLAKKDILKYKVVISLEGNDVSTGLKWMLFSNSVVMMPPPTVTSWLMEELLEPWVHYIPLKKDSSDAEEMITWVGENDLKARRIAERGTLFMYDLLYHPEAEKDDILVKNEIVRRYRRFWS